MRSATLSKWIATCGGLGLLPVMPGTWGALAGIPIHIAGRVMFSSELAERLFIFVCVAGIFTVGYTVYPLMCEIYNEKDPKRFVLDEVVGYLVVPLVVGRSLPLWLTVICGFFLFRLCDVIKLPGAKYMDSRDDYMGVMFDDVISGAYASLILLGIYYGIMGGW